MLKQINAQEYIEYKSFLIPGTLEVEKEVFSFIYDNTSYQIERLLNIKNKVSILRVEGNEEVKIDDLPKFIKIKEDITEKPDFFTNFFATENLRQESTTE